MKTLDELLQEYEPERRAQLEREDAIYNSPETVAQRNERWRQHHENGVRQGWWDEEGNPLNSEEDDEDYDDGEGDEYDDPDHPAHKEE